MEFVSRKLKAVKPVSKEKDSRDIYIGRTTPWVRYEKESGDTYVRFDGLSEELEAVGWTEDDIGTFVKAERYTPKGGMRVWSYKPIRD